MAEYIEREAALKVLRGKAVAKYPSTCYMGLFAAANEVGEIPAADVVEVPCMCLECEHWENLTEELGEPVGRCINPDGLDNYAYPNDFCSYGEKRTDNG